MARTLFEHAHVDGEASFPAGSFATPAAEMFCLLPSDWSGTSKVYIWFLAGEGWVDVPFDITIRAATDGENATGTHSQTVNGTEVDCANGDYEKWDVTTICATVIALFNGGDMIWIDVSEQWGVNGYTIGVEIIESS